MMRRLLPLLLLLLGAGGGVGAGLVFGGGDEVATADVQAEEPDDATHDGEQDDVHDGEEDHEEPEPPRVEQTGEGTEYVRLNNQFVVPIVRNGAVRSLVVLGLTIEVTTGQNNLVFDQEPRLRDSFLRVLFAHANTGGFDGVFTEAEAMEPLREGLREAAQGILGRENTFDVLITDITRQDA
ncbi:flagellar basal body-associated FliL family protein [Gymnodinialimonas hymeniacidonis]|uniref:flagellar basal body-associated FliL family protein n=1 Tax=Gymnodinialimonas hymeniacidonis TaxID=3126508 RepID=UPI0034C68C64